MLNGLGVARIGKQIYPGTTMKFIVTYELKPNGAMSYEITADNAAEARRTADSWQRVQAPSTKIRKVTVKEVKA